MTSRPDKRKWLPTSLLGQVMASAMLALLVAQIASAFLLYKATEDRLELSALTALTFQLSIGGDNPDRFAPRRRLGERGSDQRDLRNRPGPRRLRPMDAAPLQPAARLPRHLRYRVSDQPDAALTDATTQSAAVKRLRELLALEGIDPTALALEIRSAGSDPQLLEFVRDRPRIASRTTWRTRELFVASLQRTPGAPWETARVFERKPPKQALFLLFAQTILTYALLAGILFLVLRRITRPLALLTARVDDFSRAPERAVRLEESGPSDTRQLIRAHNAMESRIAAMLDEKDVMLGAIGHDLKTPLAALRVRIESVPDEAQRARMADSIEDITRTLDDILSLARVGRADASAEPFEAVDITALADSVVEEFEDLGDPVTLAAADFDAAHEGAKRLVAPVQVTWLKRALRNLVSNAVRYGGCARVSVGQDLGQSGGVVVLRVEDDGPGIPADRITDMLEAFTRGEASRNRATGGAGLGLTLARAIAEAHGGKLTLINRQEAGAATGLTAELRIPV
ncbi:MAG: ATP-binding protein [Pseudomonadota bacterium]